MMIFTFFAFVAFAAAAMTFETVSEYTGPDGHYIDLAFAAVAGTISTAAAFVAIAFLFAS